MLAHLLLLVLPLTLAPSPAPGDKTDDFFAAVRKGDVKTVEELIASGVDVNTKFRYNQTALFPACDKGLTDMVRVLLLHGAEVNVEDTFYHATPLSWAVNHDHVEIIRMLLQKGAKGKEDLLIGTAAGENPKTVEVLLEVGGYPPATLSTALGRAIKAKRMESAELLKKAGAVPPPVPDFKVDEATLKTYAGAYTTTGGGPPLTWVIKDGKLSGGVPGQNPLTLGAFSAVKFTAMEADGINITFDLEDGKVTGLTLQQGSFTGKYKKTEDK